MRGAIIGYGTIAVGHHEAYLQMDELKIGAVVDAHPSRREEAARMDPSVAIYSTIDEMFGRETVDFVDICAPPDTHLEYQVRALDHRCHVLCEKPLLLKPDDFRLLRNKMQSSNCFVYPCHNYKFSPMIQEVVSLVSSREFGDLVRGYFRTTRIGHARGVKEWNPHWRRYVEHSGGGILQDHGTHGIYLAIHLCGQAPRSVSCILGNLRRDEFSSTEDSAFLVLRFPEGVEVQLDMTWASSVRQTSYALTGTRQSIVVDNDDLTLSGGGDLTRRTIASDFDDPTHRAWFVSMFSDFASGIGDPNKQQALLAEAWSTGATVHAAYESARLGGTYVPVPPWDGAWSGFVP